MTDDKATENADQAAPFVAITDDIDRAVSSLRVVWLALMAKDWLDSEQIDHCADVLDRAISDLAAPRAIAQNRASEIYTSAFVGKGA
ncbi:hypothetical protein [Agrobacterium vitis]|uniref:hypothetical protein n=1 Tax=Agrobacterium vitis TaxID=373 RepID=UPI0012E88F55|nr:hypothetical protein [Agrobacterium vitis]MVA36112.1 hypothetical protein [Agrobacterium vitis]